MENICDCCNKKLRNKSKAIGITNGIILNKEEGFVMDINNPWLFVICKPCVNKIIQKIKVLQ